MRAPLKAGRGALDIEATLATGATRNHARPIGGGRSSGRHHPVESRDIDLGQMRDLIDVQFALLDPDWRRNGVTYNVLFTRLTGGFQTSVIGAGDRDPEFFAAIRRGTAEYERREKLSR